MIHAAPGRRELPFRIAQYQCEEDLGGHMAEVYRARDLSAGGRQVVIKRLRVEDCRDAELRKRFSQEAEILLRCSHPNIVTGYDMREDVDQPYLVMEYLEGETLRTVMDEGGTDSRTRALSIAFQIASALEYVHANHDVIHRDLKPENVHVDARGRAKLIDFGVARFKASRMSQPGQRFGAPRYMSPEQVGGKQATAATDVYSFCVLLFELLTQELPYRSETAEEFWAAILNASPNLEPLRLRQVPEEIINLIARGLAKNPEQRFQSFGPVREMLQQFVSTEEFTKDTAEQFTEPAATAPRNPRRLWVWTALGACVIPLGFLVSHLIISEPDYVSDPNGNMVLVEAGAAVLGPGRQKMTISSFYIDETEVTNHAYRAFCRHTGHSLPPNGEGAPDNFPVVNVSFYDAKAFAHWAKKRLPSAAEWEKAARGPRGLRYPWGNEMLDNAANLPLTGGTSAPTLMPARSNRTGASPYGALNMIGNVWEWVATRDDAPKGNHFENYQHLFAELAPPLSPAEPFYQVRGGSYLDPAKRIDWDRLVSEAAAVPGRARKRDIGFRCARDP